MKGKRRQGKKADRSPEEGDQEMEQAEPEAFAEEEGTYADGSQSEQFERGGNDRGAGAFMDTARDLAAAYSNCFHAQQAAQLNYTRRSSDAYFDFLGAQQEAHTGAYRPVVEAHFRLVIAAQFANGGQDGMRKYQEAYQELVRAQTEYANNDDLRQRLQSAREEYTDAVRRARDDAEEESRAAYGEFIEALKRAWANVDSEKVDPQVINSIKWLTAAA